MDDSRLRMAMRHTEEGRRIVERQRRLIADQQARGENTERSESLLVTFELAQAVFEDDLTSIRRGRSRRPAGR